MSPFVEGATVKLKFVGGSEAERVIAAVKPDGRFKLVGGIGWYTPKQKRGGKWTAQANPDKFGTEAVPLGRAHA